MLPQAQRDLANIARTIARFEPVPMLVRPDEMDLARSLVGDQVELIAAPIDDLWMRDAGAVFVRGESDSAAVDFNFNGWGDKQRHRRDAKVAEIIADRVGVERLRTDLVLEGGGLEVDGQGTAIITTSCVPNSNRNPGWRKHDVEEELAYLLGLEVLEAPSEVRPAFESDDFAAGYIHFYVCNGAVIAPEFGDWNTDRAAAATLRRLFPRREVVQINIDAIAAGGGGIHCTTQQEPVRRIG